MSEVAARFVQMNKPKAKPQKYQQPEPEERKLGGEEKKALAKLQREARQAGASLHSDGKGGLPPSLVLHVMRRDEYTCKACGLQDDLSVHHKGGLENPGSEWLEKKGHENSPQNLTTICNPCHDRVHQKDRAAG